jgi:4-methylaminobutanoate oxidase (formaldehyde-forming)
LTDARLDDAAFPFATAQEIDVGWTTVLALRVSFVGELGWELYAPVESLVGLYDRVVAAGEGFGLRHAGYHALDGLRAEKGYRHWGPDMGPADSPYEAGLGFTVDLDKAGGFIGRKALRARSAGPLTRRLVHVRLDDPEPLLYGGESLLCEGAVVGRVTSGAYGHTLGAAVGLAFVEAPSGGGELRAIVASRAVTVDVAGTLVPATLSERPFYDPGGGRLRGTSPPETVAGTG